MRELMGQEVMSEHQLERDISSKNKLNVSLEITHNKVWEETLRARYKILTVMLIDQYMQASSKSFCTAITCLVHSCPET
jgi:hypothetical protein